MCSALHPISRAKQHDYNKNIFIYINNQFIHFLPFIKCICGINLKLTKERKEAKREKRKNRRTPENLRSEKTREVCTERK